MTTNLARLTADIQRSQATYRDLSDAFRRGMNTIRNNPSLLDDDDAIERMTNTVLRENKTLDTLINDVKSIDKRFKQLILINISELKKIGRELNDPQNQVYYNRVLKSGLFGGYKLNNKNMVMPQMRRIPDIIARLSTQVAEAKAAVARANAAAAVAKRQQQNQARRNAAAEKMRAKGVQNAQNRERTRAESERRNREALEAQERKRQNNAAKAAGTRLQAQQQRQLNKQARQQRLVTLLGQAYNKGSQLSTRFANTNNNNQASAFGGGGGVPRI